MNHWPDDDAPCFKQFWRAGELNPTRALLMHEHIEEDAAQTYEPPRLRLPTTARGLPTPNAFVMDAWHSRRSIRAFSSRTLELQALSGLLWPHSRRPDGGRHLASGGGKYPLQIHVAGWRLSHDGHALEPTISWYDPLCHGLTAVRPSPDWAAMSLVLGISMNTPAAVLVVTAQAGPHTHKYGERGGRFLLLEAGSYLGVWQAETARLGLGGVVIGSYQDRALLRLLGPHVSGADRAPDAPGDEHLVIAVYALGWPDS